MKIKKWKDMSKKEHAKLILTIIEWTMIVGLCGVIIWGTINTLTKTKQNGTKPSETVSYALSSQTSNHKELTESRGGIMPMSASTIIATVTKTGLRDFLPAKGKDWQLTEPNLDGTMYWRTSTTGTYLTAESVTIGQLIQEEMEAKDFVYTYTTGAGGRYKTQDDPIDALNKESQYILIAYSPQELPPEPPTYYYVGFLTTGLAEGNPSYIGDIRLTQVEANTQITIPVMKVEGYEVSVNIFDQSTGEGQSYPITSFPMQYNVKSNISITYNFSTDGTTTTYQEGYQDGYSTGTGQGFNSGYNEGYGAGETAGYDTGYQAGMNAVQNFNWNWLISFTDGLFSSKLFGEISLGTIAMAMIAIAIMGGLLKLFFGG